MHKLVDKLESKLKNKASSKILFNKYYNLKDIYWNLFYTFWFGVLVGIGNAIPEIGLGFTAVIKAFIQGFINNSYLAIIVGIFYAKIVNLLENSKNTRIYANLLWAVTQLIFLIWHFQIGTLNPIRASIGPIILGLILTNYHVNALKSK